MKRRTKGLQAAILLVLLLTAAIAAANFFGVGTMRSAVRIGYTEHSGGQRWEASYVMLSGTMKHTIHPKDSQKTLHMEVVTEGGNISIEVTDGDGNVLFDEERLETSAYDVPVSGKVVVRIEADGHEGGFNIEAVE